MEKDGAQQANEQTVMRWGGEGMENLSLRDSLIVRLSGVGVGKWLREREDCEPSRSRFRISRAGGRLYCLGWTIPNIYIYFGTSLYYVRWEAKQVPTQGSYCRVSVPLARNWKNATRDGFLREDSVLVSVCFGHLAGYRRDTAADY